MMTKKLLPERSIGKSGGDLFSKPKDLTVIMIPFERFSSVPKAVDRLYRSIDVPFNLIVIEGNSPESVRHSLEKRRRRHNNITIIYSEHQVSIGSAINLATPHLNTPYAFIMDADVRVPRASMPHMLRCAKDNQHGIVCPDNYVVPHEIDIRSDEGILGRKIIKSFGVRTCFLISQEAIQKLGKFDEIMTPCTAGIDIRMAADACGVSVCTDAAMSMESDQEEQLIWPIDASFHSFQWNQERVNQSFENLEKKWGISLRMQDYSVWLNQKKQDLNESRSFLFLWTWLASKLKSQAYRRQTARSEGYYFSKVA